MTDLSWLDAIEARHAPVMAGRKWDLNAVFAGNCMECGSKHPCETARLVKAQRDAQGHIEFKAEEIRGLRREVEEATRLAGYWRMKVARVDVIWENDDGHATYCESLTTGRGRDCNCWRATIGAILEETE